MSRIADLREAVAEANARGRPLPEGWAYWPFCEAEDKVPKVFILYDGPSPRGGRGWRDHVLAHAEEDEPNPFERFTVEFLREEMRRAVDKASKRRRLLGVWPPPDVVFEGKEFRVFEVSPYKGESAVAIGHRGYIYRTPQGTKHIPLVNPARQPVCREVKLRQVLPTAGRADLARFLEWRREAEARREAKARPFNIRCFTEDGERLHGHRKAKSAFRCKQGAYWAVRDEETYAGDRRLAKRAGLPGSIGPMALSAGSIGDDAEWSAEDLLGPPPITRVGRVRPPIERTMTQKQAAHAAREWHARWKAWRAKLPEEIVRAFPAGRYDEVVYWATKPLKRAHTSQGTHSHGTGTLSLMLRADGSRVYELPEGTVAPGLGDTSAAMVRERQKMNGGRKRRETVTDFSDPTAEEAIGTMGKMMDELEDAAIPEEIPEWSPEEPTPESTEEMAEFLESDPEMDEDFSPSLLDPFRAELGAITAEALTDRQHEAFYLAHVDGMSNADVAEAMGIKTDTARKLVLEARRKVQTATGQRLPNRNRGWGMAA
jgi:DNA-directed RNA polymerase specialized sigma24 family protein